MSIGRAFILAPLVSKNNTVNKAAAQNLRKLAGVNNNGFSHTAIKRHVLCNR